MSPSESCSIIILHDLLPMLFLVFLLTLERAGGTKLRAGGMGQEEKPTGGERREVTRMEGKKKIAAQVHDSFNSKMQPNAKGSMLKHRKSNFSSNIC